MEDIKEIQQDKWMKASRLTGDCLPFVTPYSAEPDKGVKNVGRDECYIDQYVSLQDTMRKYLRDGYRDLSDEFAYDENEVDFDESPVDVFDEEDPIERQINLEEWLERHPAETQESDSADVVSDALQVSDKGETSGATAEDTTKSGDVEA